MPPEKKIEKPKDLLPEVVVLLLAVLFLYMLYIRYGYFLTALAEFKFPHFWYVVKIVGELVVAATLVGIVYSFRKLKALHLEEKEIYGPFPEELKAEREGVRLVKNDKWERVITHLNSNSPGDWRLAIIEADVILDEVLRKAGYHGDSIGEMLKGVEPSDMLTLDAAWEAHKVRNLIAHAGGDYYLTERDAKRVVSLYEAVFKEFKII